MDLKMNAANTLSTCSGSLGRPTNTQRPPFLSNEKQLFTIMGAPLHSIKRPTPTPSGHNQVSKTQITSSYQYACRIRTSLLHDSIVQLFLGFSVDDHIRTDILGLLQSVINYIDSNDYNTSY
jgi:hypothetical protein